MEKVYNGSSLSAWFFLSRFDSFAVLSIPFVSCVSFLLLLNFFYPLYIHTRITPPSSSVAKRRWRHALRHNPHPPTRSLSTLLVSLSCQPPQLQEQRDDQYVALERRRNGSYVIGRLWCSWGAERGRGKGTFSRRFLEKHRRGDQAWLRPDMPSYEREKMMRRRVAPMFCISLSLAGWLTGTPGRDRTTRTERQRAQGRLCDRSYPTLINLSEVLVIFALSRRCAVRNV